MNLFTIGIIYRVIIILANTLFFKYCYRLKDKCNPLILAVQWNLINLTIYYVYHYIVKDVLCIL